ncbi:hypothetical protein [Paraliomyxa miuraensis]|uniref:hypothetical protein n=1 Tax=Paraliomyxa miuraensis TaxID=376150 RepID=UPI002259096F|nr:hypothetical protein [Paraliomyxa miuraensis]MCX4246108.1 hypothetical protein [Paraliomyxa miuraensis]
MSRPCSRSSVLPSARLSANQPTRNHAGPLGLARSFEIVKPELLRVPASVEVPVDIDVPRSARAALRTAKRLATLLPALGQLGDFELRPIRRLRFYAGAALYMHLLVLSEGTDHLPHVVMRDAAFALFLQAHQHCLRGVMRLRWAENDAGAYLPPLCRRKPWMLRRAAPTARTVTTREIAAGRNSLANPATPRSGGR